MFFGSSFNGDISKWNVSKVIMLESETTNNSNNNYYPLKKRLTKLKNERFVAKNLYFLKANKF